MEARVVFLVWIGLYTLVNAVPELVRGVWWALLPLAFVPLLAWAAWWEIRNRQLNGLGLR